MNRPSAPSSQQQLIHQYNTLKQELVNQTSAQLNSAVKFNSTITLLFQNVLELFNGYTNKINLLLKENNDLRSKLFKYQNVNKGATKSSVLMYNSNDSMSFGDYANHQEYQSQDSHIDLQEEGNYRDEAEFGVKKQGGQNNQQPHRSWNLKNEGNIIHINRKGTKDNAKYQNAFLSLIHKPFNQSKPAKRIEFEQKLPLKHYKKTPKGQDKSIIRQEFANISRFVKQTLSSKLQYMQDHKNHSIPKKYILNQYFIWCQQNGRKVLKDRASTIQMVLTNNLKSLFPQMSSSLQDYRGLRIIDDNTGHFNFKNQAEEDIGLQVEDIRESNEEI